MKYNALESKYKLVSLKKALASQELDRANRRRIGAHSALVA